MATSRIGASPTPHVVSGTDPTPTTVSGSSDTPIPTQASSIHQSAGRLAGLAGLPSHLQSQIASYDPEARRALRTVNRTLRDAANAAMHDVVITDPEGLNTVLDGRYPALRSLDVSANGIGDDGARELAAISTLTSLDISFNRIGNDGALALAGNTTLRKLNLRRNRINNDGALALVGNTTLRELDLRDNEIGDAAKTQLRELASKTGRTILVY